MNFAQLESFRWIARLGSFSQAAHKVNATQSTVSTRLAELEKELGVLLFDRSQRIIRLTPKGRDLLRYADEILQLVAEIRQYVGNPETISGTLRIGAAELIALTWLPDLIGTIKKIYPRVDVVLQIGLGGKMLTDLRTGEIDLVLTPVAGKTEAGLRAQALGTVNFGYLASPRLALPTGEAGPARLQAGPLITHGQASVLHEIQRDWFERGGVPLARILTSNSMEAAARLAEAGLGITFLPLFYYEQAIAAGRLREVCIKPRIAPIRFAAVSIGSQPAPLVSAIAKLAARCTKFDRSGSPDAEPPILVE